MLNMIKLSELKTGDIIFTASKGWLSRTIRGFTNDEYSHAGVIVKLNSRPYLFEAQKQGLVIVPITLEYLLHCKLRVSRFEAASVTPGEITVRALEAVGTHYDFKGLVLDQMFSQVWKKLFNKWVWKGTRQKRAEKSFYCFEFVAWLYKEKFPNWWKMDPEELIENKELTTIHEWDI